MDVLYGMGDYEVRVVQFDSKAELIKALQGKEKYILLEETEPVSMYIMASYDIAGSVHQLSVGMLLSDIGLSLHIAAVPHKNMSLIWYNCCLSLLNLENGQIVFTQEFCTPIMFCKCYFDDIFVITEDCIYLFSCKGERKNMYLLDDVLCDFRFLPDALLFHTNADSIEKRINLSEFGVQVQNDSQ